MKRKKQGLEQSFNDTYKENEEMFGNPYKELQDYFIKYPLKGTVLDLGCGQGRDSLFLASIGYKVTSVDTSSVGISQMIEKAKEKGFKLFGIVEDVLALNLERKFDILLLDMLLHSFKKPEQIEIIKKYSKNLKENGIFCIVYPDDINAEYFLDIFESLSKEWKLTDKITIHDVPKLENDEDFTFEMIILKKN